MLKDKAKISVAVDTLDVDNSTNIQDNKENITGYEYESWHYRYLGVELATKVYESKLTYDEYYAYYCEYKNEC